jgi:dihydropteroate synthase-like protein
MAASQNRVLFVTGRLAEPALRRLVAELGPRAGFEPDIAVMPISVAALLTTDWVAERLEVPEGVGRVVLPGFCRGAVSSVSEACGVPAEHGPKDLRDLPEYFGQSGGPPADYGRYDIEILAEINHAPALRRDELVRIAQRYRNHGADVIDLGCDPGATWSGVGDTVRALRDLGLRVSIDSMNVSEIAAAAKAGAELVLSVNSTNREAAADWDVEVVAIPDESATLSGLDETIESLAHRNIPFRIDPILEPIGFGFAASLGRCLDVRRRYPDASMLMGVGNLTELTEVDSVGVNVLLAGFCQELGIRSVLTTEVISWCQSCIRELDVARRLVFHAFRERTLPKKLDPRLVMLRDPKVYQQGDEALKELAANITDRNYRLFAENGELHVINGAMHLRGQDPFALFGEIARRDATIDPAHAFYLGYELAKAATALTLGKNYAQDQALRWGMLTKEEHENRMTNDPPMTQQ